MDLRRPRSPLPVPPPAARELRGILRALPDGVCLADARGRLTDVNERFCAMTGFEHDELVGLAPPYPFWPEDTAARVVDDFRAALDGDRVTGTYVFRRKDGSRFDVTISATTIEEDDPSAGIVAVIREITREVREREQLREAHRVARLVSMEYDLATGVVELSRDLSEIRGLDLPEDATLPQLLRFVPDPHREPLEQLLEAVVDGRRAEASCEINIPVPGLEWLEIRMQAVPDRTGHVARVRGTAQDITARKEAELALADSEHRLRQAQRVAKLGSFDVDYSTGEVRWSPGLFELFGLDPDTEAIGLEQARSVLPADEAEAIRVVAQEALADGVSRSVVHAYERDGERYFAELRIEPVDEHRVRGTVQDITERERAAREIHLQSHLLDSVHIAVVAFSLDGTISHWNRGAELLTGRPAEEAIGESVIELAAAPESAEEFAEVLAHVPQAGYWEGEVPLLRKDGTTFPAFVRDALFCDPEGRPAGIAAVAVDITERVEAERQLRAAHEYRRAITDHIGEGLCVVDDGGRLSYLNRAGEELLGWTQEELLGKVMHDVVHFRRPDGRPLTRDECGLHAARATGEVTRIDDEMFIRKDGSEIPVEVTSAPFETAEGERGSVVLFSDISARKAHDEALQRRMETMTWVGRVYDALAEGRFCLHAQPIVDLATGETVQHELLLRMVEEDGSLVAPADFLPAAEEHGVITDVDRWVMREAVGLAARGQAVELNLSAHSIGDLSLLDDFSRLVRSSGADPSLIVIELTETALLSDEAAELSVVERAQQLGCRVALDDFGTGYGGFSYLKRLPFDLLKIDREFVRDLVDNAGSRQVVEAVVGLARGFGQQTVAEGVEDERTLELLREMGVDLVQGYLLARPAPVEDVLGR